ncbi:MAG: Maf-like protein [Pseudomonadota bacterium]|jgi:septum formation protein
MRLILASGSPYRKELLSRLGLPFETLVPHVDESAHPGEDFEHTARRLSIEKARVIAQQHPEAIVIGSDQVAHCEGRRLDKPGTAAAAIAQLAWQRGKTSWFHTALTVASKGGSHIQTDVITTEVRYHDDNVLTDAHIAAYVANENPVDCAGAAKSEGLGVALMAAVRGDDPSALVGLPLIALCTMLRNCGVEPLSSKRSSAT